MNTLIKKKELAVRLSVNRNTISNMEKKGFIQGIHLGTGGIRYDAEEIISNLKKNNSLTINKK